MGYSVTTVCFYNRETNRVMYVGDELNLLATYKLLTPWSIREMIIIDYFSCRH